MQYELTAISGPTKGASWLVGADGLIVGRTSDCDVAVLDPAVSRHHCRLYCDEKGLWLEDLGSRNPVLVNGEPASKCQVKVGDELAVGRFQFLIAGSAEPVGEISPHDSDTNSALSEGEAFILATDRQELWKRQKPRTLRDLATLYDVACELSCAEGMCDLLDRACRRLRERFDPLGLWIVRSDDQNEFVVLAEEVRKEQNTPPPLDVFRRVIEENSGLALPQRRQVGDKSTPVLTYAAPLAFGQVSIGGVVVQVESPGSLFDEADLRFLVLLAQSLAPLIEAMETVEQLHRDNERLRAQAAEGYELIGDSRDMGHVRRQVTLAAKSSLNVLITGETGTGKELAARLVHLQSDRRAGPFVVVNCAAIPRNLFENELFGHEQGAFTGAQRTSPGLVDQANYGTLFLDEVGDLSLENQARILRLVENGTYRRVGGQQELHVDIRVIAATNKPIQKAISQGQFREDFYQRLSGFELCMPPLRERRSDVELLARHFFSMGLSRAKRPLRGIAPEAIEYLRNRRWPGNVRELRNTVFRAIARAADEELKVEDFAADAEQSLVETQDETPTLAEVERRHIEAVLRRCHGHVGKTAQVLGIARSTLYEKMNEYGITR
ncbi:MAG: sigma 54-interacting transcriptional regulator [Candidatus Hydrogenedentes bacterium]|nr:sigma 54-interacting transcriptional regulator [Candidatus Hydrogenedentota bacterium]